MKKLAIALLIAALSVLAGCASINNAGTAKYSVEPIVTETSGVVCCRVSIDNGKEYALLKAHVERKADGSYVVDLDERTVKAFEGQTVAAGAAKAGVDAAAAVGAAVIGGPVIGAGVKLLAP